MNIERSVGAGPRRGADQACTVISNFVVEIAKERAYPDLAGIRAGFQKISPTLGVMLTTRSLGEPAISVQMPELQVQFNVSYSPDEEDELTVPSLLLLGKLAESDPIQIVLHSTGQVHQSLQERLREASSRHITFMLAGAPPLPVPPVLPPPAPDPTAADEPAPRPEPLPEPALRENPYPEPPIDPDPELGMPPVGKPDDYVPPDVNPVPPAGGYHDDATGEPVIYLDGHHDAGDQGFLNRPALD